MNQIVYEISIHEDSIRASFSDIQTLKNRIKAQKEIINDGYKNDAEYSKIHEEVSQVKRKLSAIKTRINNEPSMVVAINKLAELKEDIKDVQMSLFSHLEGYSRQTGANQIEINSETFHIVKNYKLTRKLI